MIYINEGTILFQIDEDKLRATLVQAQANYELSKKTKDRYEALIQSKAVSQQEYEQAIATLEANKATLELTQEQLDDAIIRAPFDGYMGERQVSQGQFITKGTHLTSIINQNPMKTAFSVPERYLNRIEKDQKIEIKVAAYPQETFIGKIYFIDPRIDEQSRTALVKAYIENEDNKLRAGMFANLDLIFSVKEDAIVIPESAVIINGKNEIVFTIDTENITHMQNIASGIRFKGKVEITEGLTAGQLVVTEGHQKIRDGAPVNPTIIEETQTKQ
ncbi:MAG: efflux RND transporter periplasmic adaptor subunit [Candidatus Omnitrophica bacterium]|nr:efflux RND transporter periplasmic adaptor subunit [Candidatus Omnitrophota bacterium]